MEKNLIIGICFLVIMFTIYNYAIFMFIDTLLEVPRLKKQYRIPVGIINTIIAYLLTTLSGSTSLSSYLAVGVILLAEFILFYKDKFVRSLFCMLACLVHIMAARSICVAVFAIAINKTLYEIVNTPYLLVASMGVTFLILNICVILVIRVVPARKIKIINQHSELIWLMVSWLMVFSIYLLFNSSVYGIQDSHPALLENQIVAPIMILLGLYIVLFFSFKASDLLGYKEKSEKLEHVVEKERQYRTVIGKDVLKTIEINFTQNKILSGYEEYVMLFGEKVHEYEFMMSAAVDKLVHPSDCNRFFPYRSKVFILNLYDQGEREQSIEYRRLTKEGHYLWVRMLVALVRDPESHDVKGFAQVKNIDQEKRQQLELVEKAQKDQLTGLYNKITTEFLISETLKQHIHQEDCHALMLVDIDNFKEINDKLGHLYGDIVLAQLAEGLQQMFRTDDVVGRIGGDEFFVFLKRYKSIELVQEKAAEICCLFTKTYVENGVAVSISASVGIALYPLHGTSFDELYKKADIALYINKERGKNGFVLYEGQSAANYQSLRTEIDISGYLQKSFKENRLEYVFKLLYEAENPIFAINSVLKLITENFEFSRAFIYEYGEDETVAYNTFACGTEPHIPEQNPSKTIPFADVEILQKGMEKMGRMFVKELYELPEKEQQRLHQQGVKSMLLVGIRNSGEYKGFIYFDNNRKEYRLTAAERDEISTICHLLSTFLIKHRSHELEQQHYELVETIMDNMESLTYVIDQETYEILYENNDVRKMAKGSALGEKCYLAYRGYESPCKDCPMRGVTEQIPRSTQIIYIEKFGIKAVVTASKILWTNGKKVCLINSVEMKNDTGVSDEK